jgi:uncharacterized protein (DUF433 family)
VPYQTLRYWLTGFGKRAPIIHSIQENPARLSFLNLLECQVLAGMRKVYDLKLPRVRNALRTVTEKDGGGPHPLINVAFLTDRKDLFIQRLGKVINVSQHGQMGLNFYHLHLERVKVDRGMLRFFPFVGEPRPSEPELVEINPMIGFGKPIIAGTGVSTAIIASRFNARESIADLAAEYGCSPQQIEEAIRWERPIPVAA